MDIRKRLNIDIKNVDEYIQNVLVFEFGYTVNTLDRGNGLFQYSFTHTALDFPALLNVYHNNDDTVTINPNVGKNQKVSNKIASDILKHCGVLSEKSLEVSEKSTIFTEDKSPPLHKMVLERERKFILHEDRFVSTDGFKKQTIEQGYIMIEGTAHTRVRIVDEQEGFITFKQKLNDIDRNEFEFSISLGDAKSLMRSTERKFIKTRFSKTVGEIKIDVDMYPDTGMKVVEIEYKTEELPVHLIPNYCGKEVTGDDGYSNVNIAIAKAGKSIVDEYLEILDKSDDLTDSLFTEKDVTHIVTSVDEIGGVFEQSETVEEVQKVPEIEVVRELRNKMTEAEVSHVYSLIWYDTDTVSAMHAEVMNVLYDRDYCFINESRRNWYSQVINYLDSIGYNTNRLQVNPDFTRSRF